MSEMYIYRGDQLGHALETALPDYVVGELAEEAFDHVHPGGAGRGEVQANAGVLCYPVADGRVLVGGVVVDDEVQRQLFRSLAVDLFEERQPFLVRVLWSGGAQDPAVQVVHRGKQRDRAVPDIRGSGCECGRCQEAGRAGSAPAPGIGSSHRSRAPAPDQAGSGTSR